MYNMILTSQKKVGCSSGSEPQLHIGFIVSKFVFVQVTET